MARTAGIGVLSTQAIIGRSPALLRTTFSAPP
ncbi:hypothetical protein SVIOM342S_06447 [Streptomyces violaceorubidus]